MIDTRFLKTREDGVKLYRTIDALTNENGEVVLDKNKNAISRGYCILQNETNKVYDEAIDIEGVSYTYSETNLLIENPLADETAKAFFEKFTIDYIGGK